MATNKYTAACAHHGCGIMLAAGQGVLIRRGGTWHVNCREHGRRPSRDLRDDHGELSTDDPLVAFLVEQLEAENNGSSGFGGQWFHQPPQSGRVVNELGDVECEGLRTAADHMVTWQPLKAHGNIESRQLVIDLYLDSPAGSAQRAALRQALQALAMNYINHPGFRAEWTLT